jgi:hypothetical protein
VTDRATSLRSRGDLIRNQALLLGCGFFVLWAGASTATTAAQSDDPYWPAQLAFMTALYATIYWRCAMVTLRASEQGLRVRNVWRRHQLSWSEIERFDEHLNWFRLFRVRAHLHDGRVVPLAAITLVGSDPDTWGRRILARLVAHKRAVDEGRSFDDLPEGVPAIRSRRPGVAPVWARTAILLAMLVVGLLMMAPEAWVAWPVLALMVSGVGAFDTRRSGGLGTHSWYWIAPGVVLFILRLGVDLTA